MQGEKKAAAGNLPPQGTLPHPVYWAMQMLTRFCSTPGERLDGVAPALGRDAVGSDAGLFQCRCNARGTLPREFQVEGVRTRSGIGIADDLDPGGRIGLQILGKRCDLRLFGGADLRRTDTEEDIFTQCSRLLGGLRHRSLHGSGLLHGRFLLLGGLGSPGGVTGAVATAGRDFL